MNSTLFIYNLVAQTKTPAFMKTFKLIFVFVLVSLSMQQVFAHNVPFGFIPNQGQLMYEGGRPANDVIMYNNFGKTIILFKSDRITYLIERTDEEAMQHLRYLIDHDKDSAKFYELQLHRYFYRLDMVFENSNPSPQVVGGDIHSYYLNYYLAQCPEGIMNIYPYKSFTYKNVWDGVDIKFISDGKGIEYDIIVHPGADASQIAFRYDGASGLELHNGLLTVKNPVQDFEENW